MQRGRGHERGAHHSTFTLFANFANPSRAGTRRGCGLSALGFGDGLGFAGFFIRTN
jgi:hypothetical protein